MTLLPNFPGSGTSSIPDPTSSRPASVDSSQLRGLNDYTANNALTPLHLSLNITLAISLSPQQQCLPSNPRPMRPFSLSWISLWQPPTCLVCQGVKYLKKNLRRPPVCPPYLSMMNHGRALRIQNSSLLFVVSASIRPCLRLTERSSLHHPAGEFNEGMQQCQIRLTLWTNMRRMPDPGISSNSPVGA